MIPRQFALYSTVLFDVRILVPAEHAQEASALLEEHRKATASGARADSEDAKVFRAFRLSVLGLAMLPVLSHLLSISMLRGVRREQLEELGRRRYRQAQVINGIVIAATVVLIVLAIVR